MRRSPQRSFGREVFDGVVSYYSIIYTPINFIGKIFHEFNRVLRPGGYLLVAAKAGTEEKYIHDLLGMKTEVYFSLFQEREIECYFMTAGFTVDFIKRRNPYDFEIMNERIFALGRKLSRTSGIPFQAVHWGRVPKSQQE